MAGFSSIKGKVVRATRLDNCGLPVIGPASVVVSSGWTQVNMKRVEEAGTEFYVKNAWGDPCINDIDCTRLKRIDLTIDYCRVDPALVELQTGYRLITDGTGGTGSILAPASMTAATAATGGTLAPGTYGYKLTGLNANGETLPTAEVTQVVPAGTNTNTVTLTITPLTGSTGFRLYGRTAGGPWGLLATLGLVTTYVDTGAAVSNSFYSPPTTNTTGSPGNLIGNAVSENPASCTNGNAFSLEIWSKIAGAGCGVAGSYAWIHWLLPMCRYGRLGDFTIANAALTVQMMAVTLGSSNYGNGAFGQFVPAIGSTDHLAWQLTNVAPPVATDGYQTLAAFTGTPVAA